MLYVVIQSRTKKDYFSVRCFQIIIAKKKKKKKRKQKKKEVKRKKRNILKAN